MRNLLRVLAVLVLLGTVTALSACDSGSKKAGPVVNVYAAASLKQAFTALADRYEKDNPGADVQFNFAGSSSLVEQLTQGAKADVFASADANNMTKAAKAGLLAGTPVNFASNTLVIVTPPGNPKQVNNFGDLARPGLNVVVCARQVPCGTAARKVEKIAGVELKPVSEETSVTDVLNKVTSGQADAGLVYETDARSAGDKVSKVDIPQAASAVNIYPIGVLKSSADAAAAQRFVDLVTSDTGRQTLAQFGFAKP
ncbi:molybdate ABC transporter substrate-binding protein [Mycolicibacterium phocaicum]|uniref:Molybdate ABC transporter substrate-binding protein n=2 Tax=Mycolicibacterium phocaicum TaxID=319706 RepID=A0AA94RCA6_9MYCO|nr:molybdate ABC transporter substrate-binding protein [Mycolicibacterium phocaicum]TLH67238.1 molybdate ABC transporter substrate-binding protein [Mycolicibacterium phocaicum]